MLLELVRRSCRRNSGFVMGLASPIGDGRRIDVHDEIEETSV